MADIKGHRQRRVPVLSADISKLALGITNQRETTIVWDRATGRPFFKRTALAGHKDFGSS